MGFNSLQNFLTFPELPDVIAYLIVIALAIGDYFLKKFVQKDNKSTLNEVNAKFKKLDETINKYEREKEALIKERKQIKKEFKTMKKAIKQEANNSRELVANGTANEISKMLNDEYHDGEEEEDGCR